MARINFTTANIVTAFGPSTIGTKVSRKEEFLATLAAAIETYDSSGDKVPGQHFVKMPAEACSYVSAGVGRRTKNADDYVVRVHRGSAAAFLRRERAAEVESLVVVVYTAAAYLADPDVQKDAGEMERITASRATHVIVAVLASAGPRAPLTPHRLVKNLAGGNKEALLWSADEIRTKAAEAAAYDDQWVVVAD